LLRSRFNAGGIQEAHDAVVGARPWHQALVFQIEPRRSVRPSAAVK
jgi:hypothetical protein